MFNDLDFCDTEIKADQLTAEEDARRGPWLSGEPDPDEWTPPCPVCPGEGRTIGTLGNVAWFQCRDCGLVFHIG